MMDGPLLCWAVRRDGLPSEQVCRQISPLAWLPLPAPLTLTFATAARRAGGVSDDPRHP